MKQTTEGIAVLIAQLKELDLSVPDSRPNGPNEPPRLPPDGGPDNNGGMESRIAKLEADVGHLVRQVDRIDARTETMPADLAVIKSTMATKDWIATRLQIYLGLMIAVGAVATAVTGWLT